ncbi:AAA family ATPase [Leptolyngbya sp. NIES-2104]|uniref:AAA family ATPase n=1 Tax=Leptolyngbya sp. NIES-2104 TaxID=1552121 RepID=UPI0006EC5800|nr:AAA family ATPase [Leptolyngbya sp. NIES-2104]GAP97142.1 para family protein [Leptolyngbya sp. NIES-2104]
MQEFEENPPLEFDPEQCRNESEVESKLIVQYLLPALGYRPNDWHQEVAVGSIRLDFLAFAAQVIPFVLDANSPLSVAMEAKSPKQNLDLHVRKLGRYLSSLNIRYGLLTNGKEIRIYARNQEKIQLVFQCRGRGIQNELNTIRSLIGRENLKNQAEETTSDRANSEASRKHEMKVIAIYHNKGGVGKTTTVTNLAAAIRKRGKRVLIIDLDSQANTTFAAGLIKFEDEESDNLKSCYVYHLLKSEELFSVSEVARKADFCDPPIHVIPAHIQLMEKEVELGRLDFTRGTLVEKLKAAESDYDVVIIDTPPSLNLYSKIALIACDYLIIPSDLKPFANQGLQNVGTFIKEQNSFRRYVGKPAIEILGVLPSKISTNAKFFQSTFPKRKAAINRYGFNVLDSVISEREDLAKCAELSYTIDDQEIPDPKSVFDFKPDSPSAQEFDALATEVLQKIGMMV